MDAVASVNIAWRQSLESLVFAANKLPHRKITRWRSSFSGKQCVRGHEMEIVLFPLAAMFLTSYFYYQHGGVETSILVRCVTSAHGVLGILLFISAMTIGFTGNHNESNFKPFLISYLLPVSSILLSFILFRGNKKIHLLQIINIISLLVSFFIGGMSVTGRWL